MKKLIVLLFILIHVTTVLAEAPKYLVVFGDNAEAICYIVNNDPISKRLQLQYENDVKRWWISYFQIRTIVEYGSQKDVTDEFIQISPIIQPAPIIQKEKAQMSPGTIVFVAIAGTVVFLLVLGAVASR